jgi:hypothetical protein
VPATLRRVAALSAVVAATAALAACGGSETPAYCQDKQDLQRSVDHLKSVDFSAGALTAIKADLKNVQAAANTLADSAKQEFNSETTAFKTAVSSLGTAVETAAANPSGQSVATVAAGISGVQTAFKDLADAVDAKC